MNWLLIGVVLLVAGVVLIGLGKVKERQTGQPASVVQTGYLLLVFGGFAILAQYMSIGDTMFLFVLVTGIVTLINRLFLKKKRPEGKRLPDWIEFSRGFFPVLLVVFLIRGFLAEPFQIPSSSMRPGLIVGDFILVNKFSYGLRMPFTNKAFVPVGEPKRGDVFVFNYPNNPKENYIKRVIGVGGDTVTYRNKLLTINGQPVPTENTQSIYEYVSEEGQKVWTTLSRENLNNKPHQIITEDRYPPLVLEGVQEFPFRENCQYDDEGFTCQVPKGYYFAMGDNRDHSADSRYWGFVPEKYIVGKAFLVWMNFKDLSRIGTVIK